MSRSELVEVSARSVLDDLIRQRRRLRFESADPGLLEANRLAIVYWQLQVARMQRPGVEPTKA